jgi:hypothetical protein
MLKQQDIPSTSSSVGSGKHFYESLSPRKKKHFERFMMNQVEVDLLLELANLHDAGVERFLQGPFSQRAPIQGWGALFSEETVRSILEARNELRELWDASAAVTRKEEILTGWLRRGPADFLLPRWKGRTLSLFPNYVNLRALLFMGIMHRSARFARCHNPDCPTPYFLARRKSQKFCERGACTAYAQRQYALKWWNAEGKKRRAKELRRRGSHGNSEKPRAV